MSLEWTTLADGTLVSPTARTLLTIRRCGPQRRQWALRAQGRVIGIYSAEADARWAAEALIETTPSSG